MSKLKLFTKVSYGVGQIGEGVKNTAFEAFLFFYYNQALGLSATLAGSATLLALVVDAFFDPALGSVSDSVRTRLGRRHPFMYAGAVPFGLMFYLLFSPPGMQPPEQHQTGLFLWLTGFAIAVRVAMSVYLIPHNALGAELSADYHERTSIGSWRISLGLMAGFATLLTGYGYFFKDASKQEIGLRNIAEYPHFAALFAAIATGAVLWSALGTHSRIRHLVQPTNAPERLSYKRLYLELTESLRSPSFRALFVGTLVFFVTRGVQTTLANHMSVHFWELSSENIVTVNVLAFSGLIVGIPFWSILSRRLDKRPTFLIGVLIFSVFVVAGPVMKLVGFWPPREDERFYLGLLGGFGFLASFGAAAALISATSMMADLTDEHEYDTGRRQEGIFFGALAFSGKASSGLGHGIAGVALDLIHFPTNADRGSVPPDVVHHLGMIYGPGTILILILGVIYFARYQLTAARVADMQKVLEQRRTAVS